MSYPQGAPGGPGYPPAQQPNAQFGAPTQQFAKLPDADAARMNKLPVFLAAAIAAIGLLVYLASFGPQFTARSEFFVMTPFRGDLAVAAAVLAALIAGVGLLPKQTARPALVGVLSLLSFLLVISIALTAPSVVTIGWGLYLVVALTAIQSIIGIGALLIDAGIITARAPRPRYEQQQYGQYPGAYYGQPPGQPQHGAPTHQQAPPQQRPGYPSPYGGSGYPPTGPSTGGFPAVSPSEDSGPPTPPTGFPTYGRPSSSNTPSSNTPSSQAPTSQAPTQQATNTPTQHQSAPSSQPDQSSS